MDPKKKRTSVINVVVSSSENTQKNVKKVTNNKKKQKSHNTQKKNDNEVNKRNRNKFNSKEFAITTGEDVNLTYSYSDNYLHRKCKYYRQCSCVIEISILGNEEKLRLNKFKDFVFTLSHHEINILSNHCFFSDYNVPILTHSLSILKPIIDEEKERQQKLSDNKNEQDYNKDQINNNNINLNNKDNDNNSSNNEKDKNNNYNNNNNSKDENDLNKNTNNEDLNQNTYNETQNNFNKINNDNNNENEGENNYNNNNGTNKNGDGTNKSGNNIKDGNYTDRNNNQNGIKKDITNINSTTSLINNSTCKNRSSSCETSASNNSNQINDSQCSYNKNNFNINSKTNLNLKRYQFAFIDKSSKTSNAKNKNFSVERITKFTDRTHYIKPISDNETLSKLNNAKSNYKKYMNKKNPKEILINILNQILIKANKKKDNEIIYMKDLLQLLIKLNKQMNFFISNYKKCNIVCQSYLFIINQFGLQSELIYGEKINESEFENDFPNGFNEINDNTLKVLKLFDNSVKSKQIIMFLIDRIKELINLDKK